MRLAFRQTVTSPSNAEWRLQGNLETRERKIDMFDGIIEDKKQERILRKCLKKAFKQDGRDPLSPLDSGWRTVYYRDDYADGWVEKTLLHSDGESPEEIYEWLWEEFGQKIYSMYDCTGKAFTYDFKLVPIKGTTDYIVLHYLGLDI